MGLKIRNKNQVNFYLSLDDSNGCIILKVENEDKSFAYSLGHFSNGMLYLKSVDRSDIVQFDGSGIKFDHENRLLVGKQV